MKSIWKPVNRRLRNHIPGFGGSCGIEMLNNLGNRYYWIDGMNQNHSGYVRGGFYSSLWHAASEEYGGEYVVDLRKMLIAKASGVRAELAVIDAARDARIAAAMAAAGAR